MSSIPAFNLRRATSDDARAIGEVHTASWQTTYRGLGIDAYLDALSAEERGAQWADWLADPQSQTIVYVAEAEGRIVGFASGGRERSGDAQYKGELYALYLLEAYQRRGIGRALLSAIVQQFDQRGYPSMRLWVLAVNPARFFYESCGGQAIRQQSIEIGGVMFDEIAYGWPDIRTAMIYPALEC